MTALTVELRTQVHRPRMALLDRQAPAEQADLPRLELKMVTARSMLPTVRAWLLVHPDGFYERHEPRRVNNIYFDTPDLARFTENLSGASERRKLRLRWYGRGSSNVKVVFEVKCKRNKLGWKLTRCLPQRMDLEGRPWGDILATIGDGLTGAMRLSFDFAGDPVLINRYDREYYVSADGAVRATLDYGLVTFDQRGTTQPNLRHGQVSPDVLVVEFKAPADQSERLSRATAGVPLRVQRNSKYAVGLASLLEG